MPAEWDEAAQEDLIGVLFGTLSWLWDTICEPVVKDLQDHRDLPAEAPARDGAMPRLWWCPTGPLTVLQNRLVDAAVHEFGKVHAFVLAVRLAFRICDSEP